MRDKLAIEFMETMSLPALVMARELKMGDTLYGLLLPGDKFRFASSTTVYVKKNFGYQGARGPRFNTGRNTAVFKLPRTTIL